MENAVVKKNNVKCLFIVVMHLATPKVEIYKVGIIVTDIGGKTAI